MNAKDGNEAEAQQVMLAESGLEDLVVALLQQRPIVSVSGEKFVFTEENERRLFAYYARNRELWPRAKPVQANEIEQLLAALKNDRPDHSPKNLLRPIRKRRWRLRRIEAHRFGGLHRHCGSKGEPPENFVLEIDRDVTLVGGFNGAGKTALQNVVIWCLTGKALRSQHMPDDVHEPMDVLWSQSEDEDDQKSAPSNLALPPIVPLPSAADLEVLSDKPKIDTWAELTFQDEEAGDICAVRRALTVTERGKIGMTVTGRQDLGLSDLAIEAGTLMFGVAANMRFDEKTSFPQAVAQLTGLKPLEDLGRRSKRVVARLKVDERKKTENEVLGCLSDFHEKRQAIVESWLTQKDLGDPADLVSPDKEIVPDECKNSIASARNALDQRKSLLETTSESILGKAIGIASKQDEENLLKQIDAATDCLSPGALNGLPSISMAKSLRAISEQENQAVLELLSDLVSRATALASRLRNRQEAARWQLYSRIADWHREQHGDAAIERCPVCGSDLEEVPADALLNKGVKEALDLCVGADADAAKSGGEWEKDAAREFLDKLPASVRGFADSDTQVELLQLYRQAFVEEALKDGAFERRLAPIKRNADRVWQLAIQSNPLPPAPVLSEVAWPKEFGGGALSKRAANILRALRLARHRSLSEESLKSIAVRYFGSVSSEKRETAKSDDADGPPSEMPLRSQLKLLKASLLSDAPLTSLIRQLDGLEAARKQYQSLQDRLCGLEAAAMALESFASFEQLVSEQVTGLIQILDKDTRSWLARIYAPHYVGGPSYSGFEVAWEKGIGLRASVGDVNVPAHRVMNTSQLRACVWAFALGLWERVYSSLGGLDCLLLDDPQTYFDPINSENLAAVIPLMPAHGMRPLVTSNDHRFLAAIMDKLPNRSTASPSWHSFILNPVSRSRLTASVSPSVEEVYERLEEWRQDENDQSKAQRFVSAVRLYVEHRIWNLLASDPVAIHKPTLADLMKALQAARRNGERPFDEVPFERLLAHVALRGESSFYQIINKAHHRLYEVTPVDAELVAGTFDEIDRLLRSCAAAYARFMGRLTLDEKNSFLPDLPRLPPECLVNVAKIPLIGEVAARSAGHRLAVFKVDEYVTLSDLGPFALYGVRSPGLGTLALPGQTVLVSLDRDAQDGDPVVAICEDEVYLRRLHSDKRDPTRVALTCERTGTERVPPTKLLPRTRTRILPIVGVLYGQEALRREVGEACYLESSNVLDRKLVAARVLDDSAYPLIRSGDVVLLEHIELTLEQLGLLEDRIVVALVGSPEESFGYLKRLGAETSPGIRILENVGLKGRAIAVCVDPTISFPDVSGVHAIWRVHGTLRL